MQVWRPDSSALSLAAGSSTRSAFRLTGSFLASFPLVFLLGRPKSHSERSPAALEQRLAALYTSSLPLGCRPWIGLCLHLCAPPTPFGIMSALLRARPPTSTSAVSKWCPDTLNPPTHADDRRSERGAVARPCGCSPSRSPQIEEGERAVVICIAVVRMSGLKGISRSRCVC
ncbi:hypothetical protein FIBSPDRAFT_591553 [Athelia psychrophila]|uniref:Uncharacterized protein n=1 Tax=Athelia psychrophila TaxID=1759441 RepID=A0A166H383_9AGAM|nr:hypothetical protein FIBSPDRAFT_591553 [Fibularhizoctonia sp. CBS 109695]